jgi:hypothetical protein
VRHKSRLRALEERLVWVVGSPRTGTTWLLHMLGELLGAVTIDEPQIGTHLVLFSPDLLGVRTHGFPEQNIVYNDWRRDQPDYFFSERYRDAWMPALRALLLERFVAQVDAQAPGSTAPVIIKEPNGSQAAQLLGQVLPRSRLLAVWRDGRDVVDSELDASREGSWLDVIGGGRELDPLQRKEFLADRAVRWATRTRIVQAAVAEHEPALTRQVRYEDLLADTAAGLEGVAAWIGAATVAPADGVAAKWAFGSIDPAKRGTGKFARAADPGLWRTNLTTEEQLMVNDLLREPLARLGYPAS